MKIKKIYLKGGLVILFETRVAIVLFLILISTFLPFSLDIFTESSLTFEVSGNTI